MDDDEHRMRSAGARWFCAGVVAALAAAACGCSGQSAGYTYRNQPTMASRGAHTVVSDEDRQATTVIVIGQFANPPRAAVNWRDIGSGMSESLVRSLHNRGGFDVCMGDRGWTHAADVVAVRNAHPNASIFVIGAVTDFHHTGELPEQLARNGTFSSRNEAVVAVQLTVVDLRSGKVVVSEQIAGMATAGKLPARQLYKDLSFGSYLFWGTPLGKAADQALAGVIESIGRAASDAAQDAGPDAQPGPARMASQTGSIEPRIIEITGFRRVNVEGGRDRGLKLADELYLVRWPNDGTPPSLVIDPVTGLPVRARIDSLHERTATAWLIGEPAMESDIIGATLRSEPPAAGAPSDAASTAAASSPDGE